MRDAPSGQRGDRARMVLETAPDAFVAIDAAGHITEWNAKAEEIFGWSRAEILGRAVGDTLVPPERRAAHYVALNDYVKGRNGSRAEGLREMIGLHRDGHVFPIEVAVGTLECDGETSFYAF